MMLTREGFIACNVVKYRFLDLRQLPGFNISVSVTRFSLVFEGFTTTEIVIVLLKLIVFY